MLICTCSLAKSASKMIQKTSFFSLKKVFVAFLLISIFTGYLKANASHMAGADISYKYLGNDQYKVTYTLYSDCSGSLPPISMNASVRSNNCSVSNSFVLQKVIGSEIVISANCISAPSTCNGGVTTGFKQLEYSGIIVLQQKCNDFVFSVTDCCRNSAITSVINPETLPLYVEATLNNLTNENSSSVFSGKPIMVLATHQENQFSVNALDSDGDSLVYSLIAPKTSELTNVNYVSGYDAQHFIASNTISTFNSENGIITINPSQQETAILAVKISEYRNGELIGSTMRDVQLISTNSNNTLPSIGELVSGQLNSFSLCAGAELLINLSSVDPDAGQTTMIEVSSNIPDLMIQKSNDRLQKVSISWTAQQASGNSTFWIKVLVTDNACPLNGAKSYYLRITVSTLVLSPIVTNSDCAGKNNGAIALNISQSSQPVSINWVHNNSDQPMLDQLAAGVYTVILDNGNGCIVERNFQVNNSERIDMTATLENASCIANDGKAYLNLTGGVLPYTIAWNDNNNLQERVDLKAGLYNVEITDQIGCKISSTLKIGKETCEVPASGFKLFPNPAIEYITIQNDLLSTSPYSITINDAMGKKVYYKALFIEDAMNEVLSVAELAPGIYFVLLESNGESQILRFVKK